MCCNPYYEQEISDKLEFSEEAMDMENGKKKTSIIIPILFAIATAIWIANVCINISSGGMPGHLIALQCVAVVVFGAATIANYIRYKRSKNNKSE